jgi:hypothetical protein
VCLVLCICNKNPMVGTWVGFQPFRKILIIFFLFFMNLLQVILCQTSIVWCRFELWFPKRLSIYFSKRLPFDIKSSSMWNLIHNYINCFYKSNFDIYFKLFIFYWNALWEKWVFCNWSCNSIFELHWTFAIHYIYNAIHYNSITIFSQLLFNYYGTPLWLQS